MAEILICLDRSKPFSTVHGERTPEDPHYRVHFFQSYKVGGELVQLPFDVNGDLVVDDGKNEPTQGIVEGKPILFQPLYNEKMRALVTKLRSRSKAAAAEAPANEDDLSVAGTRVADDESVNLAAWLKGQVNYPLKTLREVVKARYAQNLVDIKSIVQELVEEHKLVPRDQLSDRYKIHIPND